MRWFTKVRSLLNQSQSTETLVYEFLDQVTLSHHKFVRLWHIYLTQGGQGQDFETTLAELRAIESNADRLRREIDNRLYARTLIPDLRSDVALLIELIDKLINQQETIGIHLKIEQPTVPEEVHDSLYELLELVGKTLDHTVLCARSFFSDLQRVREYHQKVILFESDTNEICNQAKTLLFATDLPLTCKVQLRYFFDRIDDLASIAEDVSDRISIFTLKRML
ncbi:DUF47 domain-containing protein [Ferrimonas balearica]|uniref:DUF47 domain-containing protein n=1 Tax=Ferrimonas balearica TaxID=44012 RepID=UPI001C997C0F|nr:DUF47 family protein [Ferrimonas balearica]MBY5921532.1 DUF47 family protein [Ferrimonas balearica]MBY5995783.1 DUF47 family protein [Ferrimonas balearica]